MSADSEGEQFGLNPNSKRCYLMTWESNRQLTSVSLELMSTLKKLGHGVEMSDTRCNERRPSETNGDVMLDRKQH